MKIIVVGATGIIGSAAVNALKAKGHEVLEASRNGALKVDITDPGSIRAMYQSSGRIDAVVSCAGDAAFKPLSQLTDEDFEFSLHNKLMGQVNLVRFGADYVNDEGAFVLTSGIFSRNPMPGVPAIAIANGAIESFARAAALDVPRGIRVNAVSPPFITETAQKMGMPTDGTLAAADAARTYDALVEGSDTGKVVFPGD